MRRVRLVPHPDLRPTFNDVRLHTTHISLGTHQYTMRRLNLCPLLRDRWRVLFLPFGRIAPDPTDPALSPTRLVVFNLLVGIYLPQFPVLVDPTASRSGIVRVPADICGLVLRFVSATGPAVEPIPNVRYVQRSSAAISAAALPHHCPWVSTSLTMKREERKLGADLRFAS